MLSFVLKPMTECLCSCVGCKLRKDGYNLKRKRKRMTLNDWKRFIQHIYDNFGMNVDIVISGGEPLLYSDINDFLLIVKNFNFHNVLINTSFCFPTWIKIPKDLFTTINLVDVSFYASNNEKFLKIRNPKLNLTIYDIMKNIRRFKLESGSDVEWHANAYEFFQDPSEIRKIKSLLKMLGFDSFTFRDYMESAHDLDLQYLSMEKNKRIETTKDLKCCSMRGEFFIVDCYGDFLPCYYHEYAYENVGNWFDDGEDLKKICNGEKMKTFQSNVHEYCYYCNEATEETRRSIHEERLK